MFLWKTLLPDLIMAVTPWAGLVSLDTTFDELHRKVKLCDSLAAGKCFNEA